MTRDRVGLDHGVVAVLHGFMVHHGEGVLDTGTAVAGRGGHGSSRLVVAGEVQPVVDIVHLREVNGVQDADAGASPTSEWRSDCLLASDNGTRSRKIGGVALDP